MEVAKTPQRKHIPSSTVNIPPSPLMQHLGFGRGICVYKMVRTTSSDTTKSPWAIKKVSKRQTNAELTMQRLCDEVSILRRLNHPNIIGFRAFTKDNDGKECLAMEACTFSLGDLIEERHENDLAAFPPMRILKVASDVADALDYLHNQASVLHCDIKSYNILIKGEFEICKLCDFGVAVAIGPNGTVDGKLLEQSGRVGTLLWMAPETLKDNVISDKSDIYSYGLVIWEMLALVPPGCDNDTSLCNDSELNNDCDNSFSDLFNTSESDVYKNINPTSRPALPAQEFTVDYNYVLELFYCCTDGDPGVRPSAKDLVFITRVMGKNLFK